MLDCIAAMPSSKRQSGAEIHRTRTCFSLDSYLISNVSYTYKLSFVLYIYPIILYFYL